MYIQVPGNMNIEYNSILNYPKNYEEDYGEGLYKNSRNQFIRKIYTIVTIQLIATSIMTAFAMKDPSFLSFQLQNPELFFINMFIMIGIEIAIMFFPAGRKHPTNIILLSIFTFCQSYVISYFCCKISFAYSNGNFMIMEAVFITAGTIIFI